MPNARQANAPTIAHAPPDRPFVCPMRRRNATGDPQHGGSARPRPAGRAIGAPPPPRECPRGENAGLQVRSGDGAELGFAPELEVAATQAVALLVQSTRTARGPADELAAVGTLGDL